MLLIFISKWPIRQDQVCGLWKNRSITEKHINRGNISPIQHLIALTFSIRPLIKRFLKTTTLFARLIIPKFCQSKEEK